MFGFEGMQNLLVEFNLILKNEFHCIHPNFYPNITHILGYVL